MSTMVHALWLPARLSEPPGVLALWAEGTNRWCGAPSPHDHPFAATAQEIDNLLWTLWPTRASSSLLRTSQALVLALPSAGQRPLRAGEKAPGAKNRRVALQPWRVGACYLPPMAGLQFLIQIPKSSRVTILGPSLRFWRAAALLVATALVRGQFLPSADDDGRGRWIMTLVEPDLRQAVARLAAAMPPSARALAQPLPGASELIDDFIAAAGGETLAQVCAPSRSPMSTDRQGRRRSGDPTPADHWWADLFPRRNYYFLVAGSGTGRQRAFGANVRAWAQTAQRFLASAYRLTLRLEPPASQVDSAQSDEPPWRLSFHLQPKREPDTLWAAAEIWHDAPQPDMPSALREALEQAASTYPPLRPALDQARPTGHWLDIDQALNFLQHYASRLTARGFGVLVPAWWKKRARLAPRLALGRESLPAEASGLLGLDSLVAFDWELAIGDHALTVDEFVKLAQSKTALVQVRGEWMHVDPGELQAALGLVRSYETSGGRLSLRQALALTLAGPGESDGVEIHSVRADGWLDEIARRLTGRQPLEALPQPAGFVGQLRPYQMAGLSWLSFMRQWGFGACLADDMGLGKTVEVLAMLVRDADEGRLNKPVLIVCPTTVAGNWTREVARFAPRLSWYAHHGPRRQKGKAFCQAAEAHDLVITTYALLPRDRDFVGAVQWGGVILDEAHNIKNPGTKQAQAARHLPADYRIALTGTPVENRLQDLWSIMHFLNPGYLGSAESFQRRFAGPLERENNPRVAARLRALTAPFILRRLKTDQAIIRDLPLKNEMTEYCGLTKEQAGLYRAVVQESLRNIAGADGIRRRGIVLATLTRLKQLCNHPRHLLGDQSPLKHRSGKLNRLSEMLEQALAEDDHILIFTQFAEMGELLREYLTATYGPTLFLHGGTPARKRSEMIAQFQSGGTRVFVLSLKAGGAGINLTRANRVFHYDRWWNPAVENQATDRAFRIGQDQPVQVHKLVCRGTLEERVDDLIARKTALAEQIVGQSQSWLTDLSTDELRDLLRLRHDAIDD